MAIGDKLTPLERRLFKEAVIREYKLKRQNNKYHYRNDLLLFLKKTDPINIVLGIIASILLIYFTGWRAFFQLVLTGIIWITIIASALAAISNR